MSVTYMASRVIECGSSGFVETEGPLHYEIFFGFVTHLESNFIPPDLRALYKVTYYLNPVIRYGVTANITAFHAVARGSIPRVGTFYSHLIETLRLPVCIFSHLSKAFVYSIGTEDMIRILDSHHTFIWFSCRSCPRNSRIPHVSNRHQHRRLGQFSPSNWLPPFPRIAYKYRES